jgi:hypothetical protein
MGTGKLALSSQPCGIDHAVEDHSHHHGLPKCSLDSENHQPRTSISSKSDPAHTYPAQPSYIPHSASSSPQNNIMTLEEHCSNSQEAAPDKLEEPSQVTNVRPVQLISAHCLEHSLAQCSSHVLYGAPPSPTSPDVSSSSRKRRVSESELSETGRSRECDKRGKQNQRPATSSYGATNDNSESGPAAPRPFQGLQIKQEPELEGGMDGETEVNDEDEDGDSDIVLLINEYDALMDYNRQLLLIEQLNLQRGPHGWS